MSETSPYERSLLEALKTGLPERYGMTNCTQLGRGAFGLVYEAFDREANEYVAVKVLNTPGRTGFHASIHEEAKRLHSLVHIHIIGVRWNGVVRNFYIDERGQPVAENVPYFIMEKADSSVQDEIDNERIRAHLAASYLEQAMQGSCLCAP
ncbi:MAG: protein kinase domain-containing protein [Actinophytocola sp.]|uniref:protein kinase domain-containing protein n=1 Tax=Actinophytocola sp. TaxID=1872138 RepID=UPI003D6B88AB